MIRINFQPYTTPQLESIVRSRLALAKEGLPPSSQDVIAPDGVKFAAMKVSSVSGDARRVLDICRCVHAFPQAKENSYKTVSIIRRTVEMVHPHRRTARTEDVKEVIKVLQNSPTSAYLRECSSHERMMLAALIKCVKREGVEEVKWGDVSVSTSSHPLFKCLMTGNKFQVQYQHRTYIPILSDPNTHKADSFQPTAADLELVLDSLLASRAILIEEGLVASRKDPKERKVVLNLEQMEVERVLGDVGGIRWKNALGV